MFAASKQAYRPPSARGRDIKFKLHDDDELPSGGGDPGESFFFFYLYFYCGGDQVGRVNRHPLPMLARLTANISPALI